MTDQDISRLIYEVFASVAVISFLLGYIAQRTHFCTMGSVADVYLMGDWSRALQWIIATSIATLGFALLCLSQQINPTKTLYFSMRLARINSKKEENCKKRNKLIKTGKKSRFAKTKHPLFSRCSV